MVNFIKYKLIYIIISTLVLGSGFYSMYRWGFRWSIEFTGGSTLNYQVKNPSQLKIDKVKDVFKQEGLTADVMFKNNFLTITTKPLKEADIKKLTAKLQTQQKKVGLKLVKWDVVGPVLGKETMKKTIVASLLAIIGILLYMTFAFKNFFFALSAVLAMIHDFFVLIGAYSILGHFFGAQLDTLFVTAVLTTMSFSVHDTIVVFDKIREYRGMGKEEIEYYANKALTETMVRSVNNSMTIVFMLLSLLLLGGSTIRFFAAALLIGTITGTYSSPFVATPILVFLTKKFSKH